MSWNVYFAAATGKQHLDTGSACQDAGHHVVEQGCLIAAVCDGAGSAREGRAGAELFAHAVVTHAVEAVRTGAWPGGDAQHCHALLAGFVAEARARAAAHAGSAHCALRDLACTLVGCLASERGGYFFHVGDGFAIWLPPGGEAVLSRPENGEYSDETYFVTDEAWQEHLRITPLPAPAPGTWIGLMSDGVAPFAVDRSKTGFFRPFFDPVAAFLAKSDASAGSAALARLLADEKTHAITGDDKTLLLARAA